MDFFEQYKKKTTVSSVFAVCMIWLLVAGFGVLAVVLGNYGATIEMVLFGILAVGMAFYGVIALKNAIKNPQYRKLIACVEKIGPVELIGEKLSAIAKSPLAQGELRFNNQYFFYSAGDAVCLMKTSDIRSIRPICEQTKYKNYYIEVIGLGGMIRIKTTKDHGLLLARSIEKAVGEAQKRMNTCP